MRRKVLLIVIILFTLFVLSFVCVFTLHSRYQKYVVTKEEWNTILGKRKENENLLLEKIQFNDYSLMIDSKSHIIYYSIVHSKSQYNPSIQYYGNHKNIKIAFNKKLSDDVIEKDDVLKVVLYNNQYYSIYSLVVTNYPILSICYDEKQMNKRLIPITLELFDNHVDSYQRYLKSDGKLRIEEESSIYHFSLTKESLGRNKRENHVSIFGMSKQNEYTVSSVEETSKDEKYVQFFINNQYRGVYSLGKMEGRGNFEKNHKEEFQ